VLFFFCGVQMLLTLSKYKVSIDVPDDIVKKCSTLHPYIRHEEIRLQHMYITPSVIDSLFFGKKHECVFSCVFAASYLGYDEKVQELLPILDVDELENFTGRNKFKLRSYEREKMALFLKRVRQIQ
jgi:hypothetical protein